MTSPATDDDAELEDPGSDPVGLAVPRNPLGGSDQDTGRGAPRGDDGDAPGDNDAAAGGAAKL
jgi:hypothetical protein